MVRAGLGNLTLRMATLPQTRPSLEIPTPTRAFTQQTQCLSLLSVSTLLSAVLTEVEHAEGGAKRQWFAPIVADAEAGFGGPLNAFELMKGMIEAGAAGVHFEDQLGEKKCGHLGGKVLVPTQQFIRTLTAARLAADVCDVPTFSSRVPMQTVHASLLRHR